MIYKFGENCNQFVPSVAKKIVFCLEKAGIWPKFNTSVYFRFDARRTERRGQEVEIAAFRGLFDVLQVEMSITAGKAWCGFCPARPAPPEFRFVHFERQ